jgi:hypothetical protein
VVGGKDRDNAIYVWSGDAGLEPMWEVAPTAEEKEAGAFYHSKMLDMFWTFRPDGKSYLDEKLKADGIDTVVIVGLWTDECIVATAFGALSRGYDVVVVTDAVQTATFNQNATLQVLGSIAALMLPTHKVVEYMKSDYIEGVAGAVKGTLHPDGRKDNVPPPPHILDEGPMFGNTVLVLVSASTGALLHALLQAILAGSSSRAGKEK